MSKVTWSCALYLFDLSRGLSSSHMVFKQILDDNSRVSVWPDKMDNTAPTNNYIWQCNTLGTLSCSIQIFYIFVFIMKFDHKILHSNDCKLYKVAPRHENMNAQVHHEKILYLIILFSPYVSCWKCCFPINIKM